MAAPNSSDLIAPPIMFFCQPGDYNVQFNLTFHQRTYNSTSYGNGFSDHGFGSVVPQSHPITYSQPPPPPQHQYHQQYQAPPALSQPSYPGNPQYSGNAFAQHRGQFNTSVQSDSGYEPDWSSMFSQSMMYPKSSTPNPNFSTATWPQEVSKILHTNAEENKNFLRRTCTLN